MWGERLKRMNDEACLEAVVPGRTLPRLQHRRLRARRCYGRTSCHRKDSNGAFIKDATVTVSDPARSYERNTTTSVEGQYQFLLLPPGTYTVTVQAPNFAKTIAQNVNVTVGQRAELPVVLKVAAVTETVTVGGEAEFVETQTTLRPPPSIRRASTICPSMDATTSTSR